MNRPLVIIGSGLAAMSAYDILVAADPRRWRFAGFLDDAGASGSYPPHAPVGWLGPVRTLARMDADTCFVLATASPASRRIVASWAMARGRTAASVAHPSARFDGDSVGTGHLIADGVCIAVGAKVGEQVQIGSDAVIGAAEIGPFATIGSGTRIADTVSIGDEVVLGRNVHVALGVQIGARSVIHDDVRVLADLEPDTRVVSPTATERVFVGWRRPMVDAG